MGVWKEEQGVIASSRVRFWGVLACFSRLDGSSEASPASSSGALASVVASALGARGGFLRRRLGRSCLGLVRFVKSSRPVGRSVLLKAVGRSVGMFCEKRLAGLVPLFLFLSPGRTIFYFFGGGVFSRLASVLV